MEEFLARIVRALNSAGTELDDARSLDYAAAVYVEYRGRTYRLDAREIND